MGTRFIDQINPNLTRTVGVRQDRQAATPDVWISQEGVISDWGLGEEDLWARITMRHDEMLNTGGVRADLWLQLDSGTECTCQKVETGQFDQRCPLCYGTSFVGGYEKYGHQTLNIYATDTSLTTTNVGLLERKPPYPLVLNTGQTSGTIVTPEYIITNNYGYTAFDLSAQNAIRDTAQDQITVEYSVDGGTNWYNIADSTTLLGEPTLKVKFRITMTRASASASSPFFQILRVRWKAQRETQILISKKMFPEQRFLENMGVSNKMDGITWWTTPNLGIIGADTQKIEEHDFFEIQEGFYDPQTSDEDAFPRSGRFKPSHVNYSEPTARFISQRFNIRNLQSDEPANTVF